MRHKGVVVLIRRGSTPVSTVLRKSVRFFTINIFNNKITIIELSKLKSGQMFSFSNFRALDRNPGKGTLGTLKIKKKFPGAPLDASSLGPSFRKWVSIYPRSAPGYCYKQEFKTKVIIVVIFTEAGSVCFPASGVGGGGTWVNFCLACTAPLASQNP